jgi:hypothetical protein
MAINRANAMQLNSASTIVAPELAAVAKHPSYEIVEQTMIEEYGCKATLYKHKKSGAQVMSVSAPDENKVFGITFRTPPKDSTGIPHILEVSYCMCGIKISILINKLWSLLPLLPFVGSILCFVAPGSFL